MIRHFWLNRKWVTVAVEEMIIGVIVLLQYQNFDVRMPYVFGIFGSVYAGYLYFSVGLVMLLNFLWDFYWYGIRIVLISLSGGIFSCLTFSFAINDYIIGKMTLSTLLLLVITINLFLSAWEEPRYKLKGGEHY